MLHYREHGQVAGMMATETKTETVSLFAVWKANRDGLPAYGSCCGMVRAGEVPGAFAIDHGSLVIMAGRAAEAVVALRKSSCAMDGLACPSQRESADGKGRK